MYEVSREEKRFADNLAYDRAADLAPDHPRVAADLLSLAKTIRDGERDYEQAGYLRDDLIPRLLRSSSMRLREAVPDIERGLLIIGDPHEYYEAHIRPRRPKRRRRRGSGTPSGEMPW